MTDILTDVQKMIEKLQSNTFYGPSEVILPWTGICIHCDHELTLVKNKWQCQYCGWGGEHVISIYQENGCMVVRRESD